MMSTLKDPLFWISIWGGIAGTAAIIFTWLSYRQDKSILLVDTKLDLIRKEQIDPFHWRMEVALRNKERRPCYVDQIGLQMAVKSVKCGNTELDPTGPVTFHIYKSLESGVIKIEENQRQSVVVDPLPDFFMDMLRTTGKKTGMLLIIDTQGQEYLHEFDIPPKQAIELREN